MGRLYRPAIPIEVKCRVALCQLGEMFPDKVIEEWRNSNRNKARNLTLLHARLIGRLAQLLGCEHDELRLDHDPALALRDMKEYWRGDDASPSGMRRKVVYTPDANDPEHLRYRPHGTQHAGSHDVKTRIRGDNGQFSDITLIKRERRRQKKKEKPKEGYFKSPTPKSAVKRKSKWPKRSFGKKRSS